VRRPGADNVAEAGRAGKVDCGWRSGSRVTICAKGGRMRIASIVLIPALAVAGAAAGQPLPSTVGAGPTFQSQMDLQLRLNGLQAQADMAERQAVIRETEASALEARLRTEQAAADLQAQSADRRAPPPRRTGPPPRIDTGKIASMPDDVLAQSDARVRAAAKNRR
jgi:hypothetical protein